MPIVGVCTGYCTGEHKSDLTSLNLRGQLPVYVEGEIVVSDLLAAIIWIEEQHSGSGTRCCRR